MKRKIQSILVLVGLLLCMWSLPACTVNYTRTDIIKYVRENIPVEDFYVSLSPEEIQGEDGYTDKLWTVRLRDGSGIVFHVLDNFHWGMEALVNDLMTDYHWVMTKELFSHFDSSLFTIEEEQLKNQGGIYSVELVGTFRDRGELRALADEAERFADHVRGTGYTVEIVFDLQFENPLRDRCEYVVDDGDFLYRYCPDAEGGGYPPFPLDRAEASYLLTCLDYRFEDRLSEFSREEILHVLQDDYMYCLGISPDGDENKFCPFDDLCASKYAYGVSFGTLFEVLKRTGAEVSGDAWHYQFTGAEGSTYEISYDFCDYPFEVTSYDSEAGGFVSEQTRNGYYYLKDGERVPLSYFFYNHFRVEELKEMTGITLKTGRYEEFDSGRTVG